jgi:hypothetical protein
VVLEVLEEEDSEVAQGADLAAVDLVDLAAGVQVEVVQAGVGKIVSC